MFIRNAILLILVAVLILPFSCTRLDQMDPSETQTLTEEQLPPDGSIPAKYGNLVTVSNVAAYPDYLQLWFQDEQGDLRMVRFSMSENRLLKASHLIPRK